MPHLMKPFSNFFNGVVSSWVKMQREWSLC